MALCKIQISKRLYSRKRGISQVSGRWMKNQMNRLLRRAAKRDPEGGQEKRRFCGWDN